MKTLRVRNERHEMQNPEGEEPPKAPSYIEMYKFDVECDVCKAKNEFIFRKKGVYSESDLLQMSHRVFEASQGACTCDKHHSSKE